MTALPENERAALLFTPAVIARWRERVRFGTAPNGVAVMLDAIEELLAREQQKDAEIERLKQIIEAKDDLLVAYRLGSQPKADKALKRLAALASPEPADEGKA